MPLASVKTEPTPEKLLKAALSVFSERGFSGARVDEIARRARANKAMIYYHFGTKREIYEAALVRAMEPLKEAVTESAARSIPPREKLLAIIAAVARRFEAEPALPRLLLREVLAEGRHLSPSAARNFAEIFGRVRATLAQGVRERAFRPVDPFLVHLTLVGSLLFFFVSMPFRSRLQPVAAPEIPVPQPDAFLAHLSEFFTLGLGRRKRD